MENTDQPVNRLYLSLARGDAPLPSSVQSAMARHGLRSADSALLTALLERVELDPDVDNLLAECSLPRVRAAWLTRSGRDANLVSELLRTEKRATVLSVIAANPQTPAELLNTLAGDRRPSVLEALLENPNSPDDAVVAAVIRLGEQPRTYKAASYVDRRLEQRPDLHDTIARLCGAAVGNKLLRTGGILGSAALAHLSNNLIVQPLLRAVRISTERPEHFKLTHWGSSNNRPVGQVLLALDCIERVALQGSFELDMLGDAATSWNAIQANLAAAGVRSPNVTRTATMVFAALAGDKNATEQLRRLRMVTDLELLRSTGDDKLLQNALTAAMGSRPAVGLFEALESNRSLRLQHLKHFSGDRPDFRLHNEFAEAGFFRLYLATLRCLSDKLASVDLDPDEPASEELRQYGLYGGGLCARVGVTRVQERLERVLAVWPGETTDVLDGLIHAASDDPDLLSGLLTDTTFAGAVLARVDASSAASVVAGHPALAGLVTALLSERLGEHERNWDTFAILAADSELPLDATAIASTSLAQ
jgi:hypothetical protein